MKAQVDLLKGIIEAEKQMNDELTVSLMNQLQAKTPKILISKKPKKIARTLIDVDHTILKDVKIQERVKNEWRKLSNLLFNLQTNSWWYLLKVSKSQKRAFEIYWHIVKRLAVCPKSFETSNVEYNKPVRAMFPAPYNFFALIL